MEPHAETSKAIADVTALGAALLSDGPVEAFGQRVLNELRRWISFQAGVFGSVGSDIAAADSPTFWGLEPDPQLAEHCWPDEALRRDFELADPARRVARWSDIGDDHARRGSAHNRLFLEPLTLPYGLLGRLEAADVPPASVYLLRRSSRQNFSREDRQCLLDLLPLLTEMWTFRWRLEKVLHCGLKNCPRTQITPEYLALKHHLTRRQRDVVALLLRGATNKEISAALHCSISSAKLQVRNVLRASGHPTRISLLADCLRRVLP